MPAPLDGRRVWLVGIGGAGLSAYGLLARAWGAEVGGWDRNETPYLEAVRGRGIEVRISPEPEPPEGWEVFVSSAYPDVPGRPRAELLAELVSLRPSIVVAGAHGKTTTAAMIAFALRKTGGDPSWIVGGEVPQLGANAGAGEGWLVVEGDESDRSVEALRPQIALVTNVDLDHHSAFGSRAEVEALFERWLAHVPQVVRGWELDPADVALAVPGEHNRRNAAAALAVLELAGVSRAEAAAALARFAGVARRFELIGEAGGVAVYDDYAHNPVKVAAALETARAKSEGRVLVLFQPHLFSRTRELARAFGEALAAADRSLVLPIYPARERREDFPGVDAGLIAADEHPGSFEEAYARLEVELRAGDLCLVMGAGDVDTLGRMLVRGGEIRR